MPDRAPAIVELCDDDFQKRRDAVSAVDLSTLPGRYALRHALLTDEDAEVRAHAAQRLGEAHVRRAIPALIEALADPMPSVRDRVWRALGRLDAKDLIPHAARALKNEPIWWVRRAAVRAAAAAGGKQALGLLVEALADPFWRVRHAAVQALMVLGEDDTEVREAVREAAPKNAAVAAADLYLGTIWDKPGSASATATASATAAASATATATATASATAPASASASAYYADGISDDDPAVVTARVESLDAASIPPRALVAWLGDPHAPLRSLARRRLRERNDLDALLLALRWLDEPRVPHAAAEVRALCDRIGGDDVELARRVLAEMDVRVFPGALGWALQILVARGESSLLEKARAFTEDPSPAVRRAAILGLARDYASLPLVLGALADPDEDVRAAVLSVWEKRPHVPRIVDAWIEALLAFEPRSVRERRAKTEAAALAGDEPWLERAQKDEDPTIAALAIAALKDIGALEDEQRTHALRHDDPWIRAAALDPEVALGFAATDPDPWVRRAAIDMVARCRDALDPAAVRATALACSLNQDPWIRARAADLLDPLANRAELRALLALSRDTTPMARAAAASALENAADSIDEPLQALLDESLFDDGATLGQAELRPKPREREDDLRAAAYTWLARKGDDAALEKLAHALGKNEESANVKDLLEALTLVFPDESIQKYPALARHVPAAPKPEVIAAPSRKRPPAPKSPSLRPLGQTGIMISPLVLSGAHGLVPSSFAEAREAGVNAFFWEPRYLDLTRFLRSRRADRENLVIVTGSYHAGPDALRSDVERTLRRLRTDHIDVFLLFWVRSPERLSDADFDALCRLREEGKLRAFGFSTHDRATATNAIQTKSWPVVMTRHSAAHPGAEEAVFPAALEKGTGLLTFTATCYGRLLKPEGTTSAADCYRYSLTQPGVCATLTAPRSHRELAENLAVLQNPTLGEAKMAPMRAHGARIRADSRRFDALVRRAPGGVRDTLQALLDEAEGDANDPLPPEPKM